MRRLALALCLLLFGAACATPDRPDADHLIVAVGNAPTSLDPGIGLDETSQRLHQLIFSSLLKLGPDLRVIPDLATRVDTADSQTWVIEIPRGVRFHDGREMTSGDVVYTYRRFLDPSFVSGRKGAYRDLVAVDPVDRYTTAFRLRTPSTAFPANLTNMGIVPNGAGAELGRSPIGSGPYTVEAFIPDDRVTLSAFPGYYLGAPANSGITVKVVPDETMRGLELRNGSVDIIVNDLSPDLVHSLSQLPGLQVIENPGTDFAYLGLNLRNPVLGDVRVRQAIGYAIDRTDIIQYLRRGQARETPGIIPSVSWAYSDDLFRFHHDIGRSMALLDEAGFPDPDGPGPLPRLTLTLKTSTSEIYRLQAAVLQQQLQQVGIALELRSYEFVTLFSDVVRGNFELYTLIFVGGSVADPDIIRRVFHSAQVPPTGFNRGHYSSAAVDMLIDRATSATTEAERRRLYVEAQHLIARDAPIISLWARNNVAVAQADLTGIALSPIGDFDFLRRVARVH